MPLLFTKIARISMYLAIASPLIINRALFFPFITGKILFFRVLIELALFMTVGAILYGEISIKTVWKTLKNPISIAIAVFAGFTLVSAWTAINPSFALWSNFERGEGVWQILHYCLLFWLLTLLFPTKNDWKRLIGWQAIVSGLVGLYAVGQAFNWPWVIDPPTGALSGTLGNPSYLGGYLLFSALLTLWLVFQTPKTSILRFFLLAIVIFEAIMFFTARTRGSFVALGVGTLIALFFWGLQEKKSIKHRIILAICALMVIGGTSYLVLTIKGDAIQSFQPRLWTWSSAIAGVIEKPLTGWGTENFPFVFDKYYNPNHFGIESWFDRAHNALLEYATSGGIPLAVAYLAIFAVVYWRLWKLENKGFWPLFMALPAIYLINGLVLFEILPLYIILFFILAFLSRYTDKFAEIPSSAPYIPQPFINHTLFAVCAIGIIISLYTTIYLPLQKNLLMLEALRTRGKIDDELFKEHDAVIAFKSLVGEEEAVQNFHSFTVGYFKYVNQNDLLKEIPLEKISKIMAQNKKWRDLFAPHAVGLKNEYAYITMLIVAYEATRDARYLAEAKTLIEQAELIAPTRLEFVKFRMVIAVFKKDATAYAHARKKGIQLRPDLLWDPDMAKYTY